MSSRRSPLFVHNKRNGTPTPLYEAGSPSSSITIATHFALRHAPSRAAHSALRRVASRATLSTHLRALRPTSHRLHTVQQSVVKSLVHFTNPLRRRRCTQGSRRKGNLTCKGKDHRMETMKPSPHKFASPLRPKTDMVTPSIPSRSTPWTIPTWGKTYDNANFTSTAPSFSISTPSLPTRMWGRRRQAIAGPKPDSRYSENLLCNQTYGLRRRRTRTPSTRFSNTLEGSQDHHLYSSSLVQRIEPL